MIIDGERNLTAEMAERFAEALDLDAEAAACFVDLVAYNQAKSPSDRDRAFKSLADARRHPNPSQIVLTNPAHHGTEAAEHLSKNWYVTAVRELVSRSDFREDPEWIANMLRPRITVLEAERSIQSLLALGLLVRDEHGAVEQGVHQVSTEPKGVGMWVADHHRVMMERATAAMIADDRR